MSLTTIPDISKQILLNVTDGVLFILLNQKKSINLLLDKIYWYLRFKNKYRLMLIPNYQSSNKKDKKDIKDMYYNFLSEDETQAISHAAEEGLLPLTLIKKYIEDETLNKDIVFYNSIKKGYLEIFKYLFEKYGDEFDINKALRKSVKSDKLEVFKYLVENVINVDININYYITLASEYGNFEVVKYLVEKGADIHSKSFTGLIEASEYDHLDVVKYLVENGADIHFKNDLALMVASENDHLEVVKYLVEKGADIKKVDLTNEKIKDYINNYQIKK